MRQLACLGLVLIVTAVAAASTAQGYDRAPIRIDRLKPDGWGQTITSAAAKIRKRYSDAGYTYCVGVIMDGYEAQSSFVRGTVRFWDKETCYVELPGPTHVILIYDQKGADAFQVYRVRTLRD